MSYNEWKSLAKRKGAEASITWVREAQAGEDSCDEDADHEKPQELAESNSVMPISSCNDVARFEGSVTWVRGAQAGEDSCDEDADHEKPQELAKSNSVMPMSSCNDVARFEGSALEARIFFLTIR